jgi:FAD synthase
MDFECDIYDTTVSLEFIARIRDELYFEHHEDLIRQMQDDVEQATVILEGNVGCSNVGS